MSERDRGKTTQAEAVDGLQEYAMTFKERQDAKIAAQNKERRRIEEMMYLGTPERLRKNQESYSAFSENLKTELLATAMGHIYLKALSERLVMEDNHIVIAENMIYGYIKENGGADRVLSSFKGKTYLLDRIRTIVEQEHEEIMDDVDKDNPDTQEVPEEKSKDMYDSLEKEEDVQSAIDIIANRISAAEEEFIRQNAEDKKKMEELANKVNERLQAVKDDRDMDEETKEEIAQECQRDFKRKKYEISNNRRRTVFEQMTRNLYESVITESSLREEFVLENGHLDTEGIVESAICMYGFLEMVNTLQMDRVDEAYIQNIICNMK